MHSVVLKNLICIRNLHLAKVSFNKLCFILKIKRAKNELYKLGDCTDLKHIENLKLGFFNFSWISVFVQLLGIKNYLKVSDLEFSRKYYSRHTVEELLKEMKYSTSFIVGRNPIERLGSLI